MGIHDKEGNHIQQLSIKDNIMKALAEKEKLEQEKSKKLSYIQNKTPGVYFTVYEKRVY